MKVYGKTYSQHLKEEEDLNKQIERKEYGKIPQCKLIVKKNNIKNIKGSFTQNLDRQSRSEGTMPQIIIKCKEGRQIIVLNFLIREKIDSSYLIEARYYEGIKAGRNDNGDVTVIFQKKFLLLLSLIIFLYL